MEYELFFGIIGFVLGTAALIISFKSLNHNKIEAVNAYYENARRKDFIEARRIVYNNLPENYDPQEIQDRYGDEIAILITTYEQCGLMLKKSQLPFWLFSETSTSIVVVNFYAKLEPYIIHRRKSNPLYAKNFEYLNNELTKYLSKQRIVIPPTKG